MRNLIFLAFCVLVAGSSAETLYYGGSPVGPPGGGAALNYQASPSSCWRVFDDFVVDEPWHVTEIWATGGLRSQADEVPVDVLWEIRTGMAFLGGTSYSGGTLVFSGSAHINAHKIGPSLPSSVYPLDDIRISGLSFDLPAGTYWINIWPIASANDGASVGMVHPNRPGGVGTSGPGPMIQVHYPGASFCLSNANPIAYGLGGNLASQSVVQGVIELQDYIPDEQGSVVTVELIQGGTTLETRQVTLGAGGTYNFATNLAGSYDIGFKGSHWLRRVVSGVNLAPSTPATADSSLLNGDCDGDNEVGISDYSQLSQAFGTFSGDPGWNAAADLNGDDEVSIGDYAVLSANYGLFGE